MVEPKVNTYFLCEKVNKVRWVPELVQQSDRFLTGTWDMPRNYLRIWRKHMSSDYFNRDTNTSPPACKDKIAFTGDITGIEFLSNELIAIGCSDGHLSLAKLHRGTDTDQLKLKGRSNLLHKINCDGRAAPLTGIAAYGSDVATIGEDGRLNIINTNALNQVMREYNADSLALVAVEYINQHELLISNRMGVMRLFDIRNSDGEGPVQSFMAPNQNENITNTVTCITSHPMQKHIVLAGCEEGSITVWDLRQPGFPAAYLSAHMSAVTDIAFHQLEPSKLFSASECGDLWQWTQEVSRISTNESNENYNPWLSGEHAKNRNKVTALISDLRKPINSFDSQGTQIICASDTEAVYIING